MLLEVHSLLGLLWSKIKNVLEKDERDKKKRRLTYDKISTFQKE